MIELYMMANPVACMALFKIMQFTDINELYSSNSNKIIYFRLREIYARK